MKKNVRIALLGGSYNPPHKAHKEIARILTTLFDLVVVIPCGTRLDKASTNIIDLSHRMNMVKIAFEDLEKVEIDFYDMENNVFTPTYLLQEKYQKLYPDAEIWHVIGEDIVAGGCRMKSEIHRVWDHGSEIWQNLNFAVLTRLGYGARPDDLPPHREVIQLSGLIGSGTEVRRRVMNNEPIGDLVDPKIREYIIKHRLYQKK